MEIIILYLKMQRHPDSRTLRTKVQTTTATTQLPVGLSLGVVGVCGRARFNVSHFAQFHHFNNV